jgi:hypothetical protein
MNYSRLTPEMKRVLSQTATGEVWDLGSGPFPGVFWEGIPQREERRVTAIDKTPFRNTKGVTPMKATFLDAQTLLGQADVALLSWPVNWRTPGLIPLLERADTLIYIGKNTCGTACGWPLLYQYFLSRELILELPDRMNTMLVLGAPLSPGEVRKATPTEASGMQDELLSWDQSEARYR